jgi:hypothetical protein
MNRSALRRKGSRMRATSMRRLAGGAGSLLLLTTTMLAAAGTVQASPPSWLMSVVSKPATVANGSNAGFDVTITNIGPSNISSLFLVTKIDDIPVYLTSSRVGACNETTLPLSARLHCAFGALNAGDSVNVVVAYVAPAAPATSFDPGFEGNTTGDAFKDPERSHGDTLIDKFFIPTALRGDKNFGGSFSLDATTPVSDNASLSKKNVQATSVVPPQAHLPITVEDGPGVDFDCNGCNGFGEWSSINVNNGHDFGSVFFPVTILVYGQVAPNDLSTIKVAHVHDGITDILPQCTSVHENCIDVSKVSNNVQIVVWLHQNGGVKGIG